MEDVGRVRRVVVGGKEEGWESVWVYREVGCVGREEGEEIIGVVVEDGVEVGVWESGRIEIVERELGGREVV